MPKTPAAMFSPGERPHPSTRRDRDIALTAAHAPCGLPHPRPTRIG